LTICRQQIDIYVIIELRRIMNEEQSQLIDPSQITRRDLFALATISPPLLTKIQRGWLTTSVIEEFLSEATASITTCWYLLQGDGLPIVEWTLPQYLPELVVVVKSSSSYQQRAAYLAAQGFFLSNLIAYHRTRFDKRMAYCQQSPCLAVAATSRRLLSPLLSLSP
jgi:hypothetical protein